MAEAVPWIVAGRYEVGDVVGRGGYGMVRRALDRKTGQPVAMKVLSADAGKDPHLVERMLREQQAMLAMAGTCAVTAVDLCRLASGAPCLVMEWLEGRDLEQQLAAWEAEGQRPSLPLVLELLRPLTETLQRAHELGIVHRDIKPANVFLTAGATEIETAHSAVRLLDFGLSRMRSAAPLTAVGMVMGSPSYIPPETWRGNSAIIDHRADLYSLAVIVFRMLAGRLPFETPSLLKKLELVTTGERPSVCSLRPDLPLTVDEWMKRALAIEPADRFQSGREFYDALTLALSGVPFALTEDEVSGVREMTSIAAAAPAENRNVLTVAWERATSLLQRFIGQRSAPPSEPSAPSAPPPEAPPLAAGPTNEPSAPVAANEADSPVERLSVPWIDDGDVEELPPDSAPGVAPSVRPAPVKRKSRAGEPAASAKKKAPAKKTQKKKATKKAQPKRPKEKKPRATTPERSPKEAPKKRKSRAGSS
jgi:serine/threonine-protein kinase